MRLSFSVDGPADAPVLVLSSSLGATRDMWLPQLERFSREFRVVRFDHPGHGRSAVSDDPVTIEGIGQAVVEILDGQGIERISFCGLSLGSAVGQWMAAHRPERIERLVLCSTAARFPGPDVYLRRAVTVRERGVAAISDAVVERWFTPGFRARRPSVVADSRAMLESTPPAGYAACCEAVVAFDGRDDLGVIAAPTLVIAGAEDPATTVELARALRDAIPGAKLVTIANAAHLSNVEQPEAVGDAILEHVRGRQHG